MKIPNLGSQSKQNPMRPILPLLRQIPAGIRRLNRLVEKSEYFCASVTANRPAERLKFC